MGGSSLYIEAMAIRPPAGAWSAATKGDEDGGGMARSGTGGGRLRTTGQLGDVMNESAQVRERARVCIRDGREYILEVCQGDL